MTLTDAQRKLLVDLAKATAELETIAAVEGK
jgi:hypothetical protein